MKKNNYKNEKLPKTSNQKLSNMNNRKTVKLPGINGFWKKEKINIIKPNINEVENVKLKKIKLTGSERYQLYIEDEKRIKTIEDKKDDTAPSTIDDFERALIKDKNNSFLWIKYMTFYLETSEIQKARAIAKKAIETINYRECQERFNVWMALVNLEIRFGTEENFQNVLHEALQRNDAFKIHSHTLLVLLDSEKFNEAEKTIDILKRKYKSLPEMWLLVGESYLKMQYPELSKELLSKSLLSLKNAQHLNFMMKYALMMSRYEQHDFSQTIFEKILSSYPNKTNVWYTYIDMMTKYNYIEIARSLYERMMMTKFPLKKTKILIQKYIEFEIKHGDKSNVAKIKRNVLKLNLIKDIDNYNED